MTTVPLVVVECQPQADGLSRLGVMKRFQKLLRRHGFQQLSLLCVEAFQQRNRRPNVALFAIDKFHPVSFFVGLNRWVIFGQSPFETDDAVQMAVGDMVSDLTDCPVSVPSVELSVAQAGHCVLQTKRGLAKRFDQRDFYGFIKFGNRFKRAVRIVWR